MFPALISGGDPRQELEQAPQRPSFKVHIPQALCFYCRIFKLSFSLLLALLAKNSRCELIPSCQFKTCTFSQNTCSAVNRRSWFLDNNTCFILPDIHQPELMINGGGVLEYGVE